MKRLGHLKKKREPYQLGKFLTKIDSIKKRCAMATSARHLLKFNYFPTLYHTWIQCVLCTSDNPCLHNILVFLFFFSPGIILASTPKFVVDEGDIPVPGGLGGEIFCHLISSQYFLFAFGKFSLFIVMLLSFERWYSMARPLKYRFTFSRNKTLLWIAAIMVLSFVMNIPVILSKGLTLQDGQPRCTWKVVPLLMQDELVDQVCTVVYVTITFFIPLAITLGTFVHLRALIKKSRMPDQVRPRMRELSERYFLRMCGVTAIFLGICWIPNQLLYLLSKFGVTELQTPLHHFTIVLSMLNSCVNPWIYGATNKKYRKRFLRILCYWKSPQILPEAPEVVRDRTRTVLSNLDGKERSRTMTTHNSSWAEPDPKTASGWIASQGFSKMFDRKPKRSRV